MRGVTPARFHWGRNMSDSGQPTKTLSDFEATLTKADISVASFEHEHLSGLQTAPHFPAGLPGGGSGLRARHVDPAVRVHHGWQDLPARQPVDHPQADHADRHRRHRADHHHPHRRHRSVDRRHHGAGHHHHGQACRPDRVSPLPRPSPSASSRAASWAISTAFWSPGCGLPPFIVTLGTLYIFQALKLWYSRLRIDPQRRHRGNRTAAHLVRQGHLRGRLPDPLWHGRLPVTGLADVLCAQPHRLGPSRLCRGRRSERRHAVGRADRQGAALGLFRGRCHCRLRRPRAHRPRRRHGHAARR